MKISALWLFFSYGKRTNLFSFVFSVDGFLHSTAKVYRKITTNVNIDLPATLLTCIQLLMETKNSHNNNNYNKYSNI